MKTNWFLALLGAFLSQFASDTRLNPDAPAGPTTRTPTAAVHENVTVERVVLTGRVIDRFAAPIAGLGPDAFRLAVDGQPVEIESVEWIAPARTTSPTLASKTIESIESAVSVSAPQQDHAPTLAAPSRTIVMLFQWEIAGQKDEGFLRMMKQARRFVKGGSPADRIAVLGYGSSLRLVQDFSGDQNALLNAIERVRSPGKHQSPENTPGGLSSSIEKCGPTGAIQKAIVCLGDSLRSVPGPKTLLFFGWTIGKARVRVPYDRYPEMLEAIAESQTSVFVFDVSGGSHSLSAGIAQLAADTGGLYNGGGMDFYNFPDLARIRVRQALEGGTYEMVFRSPATQRGWHRVDVAVRKSDGKALFQHWYRD